METFYVEKIVLTGLFGAFLFLAGGTLISDTSNAGTLVWSQSIQSSANFNSFIPKKF